MVSGLHLRPAGIADRDRILAWRNDPDTRRFSLQQAAISPDDHGAWFERKLHDPDCLLLVVEEDGVPAGQIRFDRRDSDEAEIHIALAPEARGRGTGRRALDLALREVGTCLEVTTVLARVKAGNETSLRAFRAAGFTTVPADADAEAVVVLERALS
jgi:RimJ/RimL family protein N-acetyltransferase